MVIAVTPALHLYCQAIPGDPARWHFVLESLDGATRLDVSDTETQVDGERLELLALVRGLEAIWQPSKLTIDSPSRYVRRGLEYGLADWRRQDWRWESFGQFVPIKNADLWQRVDAALRFHELDAARHPAVALNSASTVQQRQTIVPMQLPQAEAELREDSDPVESDYTPALEPTDQESLQGELLAATA